MSADNCHRLVLRRSWLGSGPQVNWIMLNPSTADDVFDDQTIRKCVGFSKRWGFARMVVTNLYTFRATNPAELLRLAHTDFHRALGEFADDLLIEHAAASQLVVAAWGQLGGGRAKAVMDLVIPKAELFCIGTTQDGSPLHPSRAPYTDAPVRLR